MKSKSHDVQPPEGISDDERTNFANLRGMEFLAPIDLKKCSELRHFRKYRELLRIADVDFS